MSHENVSKDLLDLLKVSSDKTLVNDAQFIVNDIFQYYKDKKV